MYNHLHVETACKALPLHRLRDSKHNIEVPRSRVGTHKKRFHNHFLNIAPRAREDMKGTQEYYALARTCGPELISCARPGVKPDGVKVRRAEASRPAFELHRRFDPNVPTRAGMTGQSQLFINLYTSVCLLDLKTSEATSD
jgi:hypothetical protein